MKDQLTKEQAAFLYDMADRWAADAFTASDDVSRALGGAATELRTWVTQTNGIMGSFERIVADDAAHAAQN